MKIGFIGTGNMGEALIKGFISSGFVCKEDIIAFDNDYGRLSAIKDAFGLTVAKDAGSVVDGSDVIILAVKPDIVENVLEECGGNFNNASELKILVSIAVGIPISFYKRRIGDKVRIVRTMPNTPALIGKGTTLLCFDETFGQDSREKQYILSLFGCVGLAEELDEKLMGQVTALTGSSPAYVFVMIEAMADAAVRAGIKRDVAYRLAASTIIGSAAMLLQTGKHPGELKDAVCSPAGTTIEAIASLERNGFRSALIEAMKVCSEKAIEIAERFNK